MCLDLCCCEWEDVSFVIHSAADVLGGEMSSPFLKADTV